MPKTVQNHNLTICFSKYNFSKKYPSKSTISEAKIFEKYGLPADFDSGHPRWGVPSTMNKYRLAMAEIASI